jgi:hypothetical protein
MKNIVFRVVTTCGSCKNRRVGGTYPHSHGGKTIGELRTKLAVTSNRIVILCSLLRLLVTANFVPSSKIFLTLVMEAMCYSETSVITRATRRNILQNGILHNPHREILHKLHRLSILCAGLLLSLEVSYKTDGLDVVGRIMPTGKSSDFALTHTPDLAACAIWCQSSSPGCEPVT